MKTPFVFGKLAKESKPMKDEVFFYTGPNITAIPAAKVPASVMYLYQHDGMWFYISAGHKAYFRKFKKDYGEKYIGTGVLVKEIIGEVE